jgi:PEP-CTERM motif-containing protein
MKNLLLLVAALALLILPTTALAAPITYNITATAPNNNAGTNNPNNSNYQGGAGQFDLDHHNAYTWRIDGVVIPAGQVITGASITFKKIANWDLTSNMLFLHLLNTANNAGLASVVDATGAPVTTINDYFGAANALGPAPGADNILLFSSAFNMVGQAGYVATDYTHTFTAAQLSSLATYIAAGGNLAFGIDPDCHYWNNGITFTIYTGPTAVPEPATLALFGSGLLGTGFYLRRRRHVKVNTEK